MLKTLLMLLGLTAFSVFFITLFSGDVSSVISLSEQQQIWVSSLRQLLPWGYILGLFFMGIKLVQWARYRKAAAFAFGMAVQMFLPDPNVQKTIEVVTEEKKSNKQSREDSSTE